MEQDQNSLLIIIIIFSILASIILSQKINPSSGCHIKPPAKTPKPNIKPPPHPRSRKVGVL
jgi:hypothetical protein